MSKATASVFALEADCEGWADVLKDMVGKMRLLFAVQFKHIKVERSGPMQRAMFDVIDSSRDFSYLEQVQCRRPCLSPATSALKT